jgi:hypothetical protein
MPIALQCFAASYLATMLAVFSARALQLLLLRRALLIASRQPPREPFVGAVPEAPAEPRQELCFNDGPIVVGQPLTRCELPLGHVERPCVFVPWSDAAPESDCG